MSSELEKEIAAWHRSDAGEIDSIHICNSVNLVPKLIKRIEELEKVKEMAELIIEAKS